MGFRALGTKEIHGIRWRPNVSSSSVEGWVAMRGLRLSFRPMYTVSNRSMFNPAIDWCARQACYGLVMFDSSERGK